MPGNPGGVMRAAGSWGWDGGAWRQKNGVRKGK